jgi:hypothetical protein
MLFNRKNIVLSVGLIFTSSFSFSDVKVERIFRPARLVRGNTGICAVQPIDTAAWLTHPDIATEIGDVPMPRIVHFKCDFTSDGTPLEFDVCGDERYLLKIDGNAVSRGPHRGTVKNWMYQSYRAELSAGKHVIEAIVWKMPKGASPLAQLSYRHGFCFKAYGRYDKLLTTGKGNWVCGPITGIKNIGKSGGAWGMGDQFQMNGNGMFNRSNDVHLKPAVVRRPLRPLPDFGKSTDGWFLYPSQLPEQMAHKIRPGKFVNGGEMKFPIVVNPGETKRILWDLGRYYCAYPEAVVKGGKGGKMTWKWAESLKGPVKNRKGLFKGNRNEWRGKKFDGFGDTYIFDGREKAVFDAPWFRCGRWCEIFVAAGKEKVEILDLSIVESRYPLECESVFETPEDTSLSAVQEICTRAMQMCAHEMFFDCPYYEQQMYPGDTRVQLNVVSSMTADDALIRRAIEIFDLNRRDDGNVPFNFPTIGTQEGASYTLCYLGMYPDYLMNHSNKQWLKARLPGLRATLSGLELYEREDGLLANLPGWSFLDWVVGWRRGTAPGAKMGGVSAELNLFYLSALQGAAQVERAFGNNYLASHWQNKAEKLKGVIVKVFFDEERGLFASDLNHKIFAEHPQCLALLADVFTGKKAEELFQKLITDKKLGRTTVYFSYYLFETLFKFGRGDIFLKKLDLWKGYVALGATTTLESPEYAGHDARSDCHAWGAHPIWFLRTGVAGIRSAAPFFEKVRIAPQPGNLKLIKASYPHPSGKMIEVDLSFSDGGVKGKIVTPICGEFVYKEKIVALKPGENIF